MTDEKAEWDIAEECVRLGADVKFRAQFDTYIKAFYDSLDLLFNASMVKEYYVPAKRFGYILIRMRDRYKDETLDLKWAGAKVRKLIDKYLESLGIDSKIPPVKLLSDDFPKMLDDHNKTGRAKASEMEHAIRWHIKVNMDQDPALYTQFSEKLQRIMDVHKEHWDLIVAELTTLRDEMAAGRETGRDDVAGHVAPFYELIIMTAEIDRSNEQMAKQVATITLKLFEHIKTALSVPNFWQKTSERRQLECVIRDELDYCGIDLLKNNAANITSELINLAKSREDQIRTYRA